MKILSTFAAVVILAIPSVLSAAERVGDAMVEMDGSFRIDGQLFRLDHFNPDWRQTKQSPESIKLSADFPCVTQEQWEGRGEFNTWGGTFHWQETLRVLRPDCYELTIELNNTDKGVHTNLIALTLPLAAADWEERPIRIDGREFVVPSTPFTQSPTGKRFEIFRPDRGGYFILESAVPGMLVDSRKFTGNFELRFPFEPCRGDVKETQLRLTIHDPSGGSIPLDITTAANRGFSDETEGDGRGGWTDQGPGNDLSMFPTGSMRLGGVHFNIIDPAQNDGRSCIAVLNGQPAEIEFAVNDKRPYRHLYLLHALAFCNVSDAEFGKLQINYSDGTFSIFPIRSGHEANDWWNPVPLENGRPVWTHSIGKVKIGLFLSDFELAEKPIRSILIQGIASRSWLIAGASLGNAPLPPGRDYPPLVMEADEHWKPMKFQREIVPGSALDFSCLLDAPAGKYGRVIAVGDHLEFENRPGVPVRFYGTNFCFGTSFPEKPVARLVAERIAAYGYNVVRIHHHDTVMGEGMPRSTQWNESRMDRLDYFVACLKERGVYVISDLFASRNVRTGEIPGISQPIDPWNGAFKALTLLHPGARENFLEFAQKWFERRNTYTNLKWKDEPALIGVTLINEGNIDHWIRYSNSRIVTELFREEFEKYLNNNKLTPSEESERERLFRRFLAETHQNFYRETTNELRRAGVKCLFTDQNMRTLPRLTIMRSDYDYVDNHFYIDHPSGGGGSSIIRNYSILEELCEPLGQFAPARVTGKPYTITEFNWCYPNQFRAESGVLTGACAALQNWSGLFRFTYAHPEESLRMENQIVGFETNSDPINLFSDRIGILLFLRGDVAPADVAFPVAVPPEAIESEEPFPRELALLAMIGQVSSYTATTETPENVLRSTGPIDPEAMRDAFGRGALNLEQKFVRSSTGELEMDGIAGTFRAVTPRSEVLILNDAGKLNGKFFSVENFDGSAVFSASSLDNRPFPESRRILLFHLTSAVNVGDRFSDHRMRIFEQPGTREKLLRHGRATVTLRLSPSTEEIVVYALDFSGERLQKLPVKRRSDNGTVEFALDTATLPGGSVAYELIRLRNANPETE